MSLTKSTRGFTLIELLIVIAIIGILAATVIFSLNTARQKARDSQVKTDIRSMMNAMEVFKTDATTALNTTGTGFVVIDDYNYRGSGDEAVAIQGSTLFSNQTFTHPLNDNAWSAADEYRGYAIKADTANNYGLLGRLIAGADDEYFQAINGVSQQVTLDTSSSAPNPPITQ